jgi:hypothetical protein
MDSLQEFNEPLIDYEQTGFLKKNIAGILDAIFVLSLVYSIILLLAPAGYVKEYFSVLNIGICSFLIFIIYRVSTIFLLSGTIGMRLFRCRYMTDTSIKLTTKEKILAAFMIYINGVRTFNLK